MKKITLLAILSFCLSFCVNIEDAFGQRRGGIADQQLSRTVNQQARANQGRQSGLPISNRVFFGGNIGGSLSFTRNYAQFQLSPIVGIYLTERLSIGGGPTYDFLSYLEINGRFKAHSFGARAFSRYDILDNIFAHAEFEYTRYTNNINDLVSPSVSTFPSKGSLIRLPLGGGYRQHLGGRSYFNLMVLYDVFYQVNRENNNYGFLNDSGYNGFIFRFGVNIGGLNMIGN